MNQITDMTAGYIGTDEVQKLYLGSELVWENNPTPVPYDQQYLTVEALSAGTFYVRNENFYFSKNNGAWTSGVGNTAMTLNQGDKVRFKNDVNYVLPGLFVNNTIPFKVYGNIESMEYGDDFVGQTSFKIALDGVFSSYFSGCTYLSDASNLVLPVMDLTRSRQKCYYSMFRGCTSLTTAPALPATTLARYCYQSMFYDCYSLRTAPELPASTRTVSQDFMYNAMFRNCSGLTTAPSILPLTAVTSSEYLNMFAGCTSLERAPVIMAKVIGGQSCAGMFSGCTSLNYIKCLATDISGPNCTSGWTTNVAASGTFVKDPSRTGWTTGVNGIPYAWAVIDAPQHTTGVWLKTSGDGAEYSGTPSNGKYIWIELGVGGGPDAYLAIIDDGEFVPFTSATVCGYDYDCSLGIIGGEGGWDDENQAWEECHPQTGRTIQFNFYIQYVEYDPQQKTLYVETRRDIDPEECHEEENCDNWEEMGYSSYEECTCARYGEGCPE